MQQLYNLSPEPDRKEFLDKLFDYMAKKGVHQKKERSNYFFLCCRDSYHTNSNHGQTAIRYVQTI